LLYITDKFLSQSMTGVQRVAFELLKGLKNVTKITVISNPYSGLVGHLYEQLVIPFKIPKHGTLISPLNIGPIFVKNQIVIIHDIASIDHPEWFNWKFKIFYNLITPILIKRVTSIVTVSQFTKSRLIQKYDVPEDKITVILNGVDYDFFNGTTDKKYIKNSNLQEGSYILSVCSIEPRKNIENLIKAWLQSNLHLKGYKLVFAGSAGANFSEVEQFTDKSIIWLGYVAEESLPALYQNAKAFVYVSLYEGFGLPPLEAMAAGIPVLASNTTAIPEVVGDCGVLVDPLSIEAIAAGLNAVVENSSDLSSKCAERARAFSWDKFSSEFLAALKKHNNWKDS